MPLADAHQKTTTRLNPKLLAELYDAAYERDARTTRALLTQIVQPTMPGHDAGAELASHLDTLLCSPLGSVKSAAAFVYEHLDVDATPRGTRIIAVKGTM